MKYKARAYAKTNLFLDVVSKRSDGYHDINTIMQSLSIYDEVTIELCDSGIEVLCDNRELSGEENIAYCACRSFLEFAGLDLGVRVSIKKNIPVAAGLGGGSADAAAVLILLNKATGKDFEISELVPLAAKLGADVPFFLLGGTVCAQGIGDKLRKLPNVNLNMVLLKEHDKQSTGSMYNLLDSVTDGCHGDFDSFLKHLDNCSLTELSDRIFNSFELCWDMKKLSKPFLPFEPLKVFLSGSGPTVCAIFEDEASAKKCAEELLSDGYTAFFAKTVSMGAQIV